MGKACCWCIVIVFLAVLSMRSYAFTDELVTKSVGGVRYTPDCLIECHLPLKLTWDVALNLYESDFKYVKKVIIGADNFYKFEMKYLVNETYYDTFYKDNITCSQKLVNSTLIDVCVNNRYPLYVEKWRHVWKPLKELPATKMKDITVDMIGYKKASLGYNAIDIIPEIKGIHLDKYAWWDSDYGYKKKIDVYSVASGAVTNFPIMLSIDTDALITAGKMQADCDDLRFTNSAEDTELDYEFENKADATYGCDAATTIIWVEVPSIASDNSTYIYMYYDYASASAGEDITGTWTSDARGVWHFDDATTPDDSTSLTNDLSLKAGSPITTTGKIGLGIDFENADDDCYYCTGCTGQNMDKNLTYSLWAKRESTGATNHVMGGKYTATSSSWYMRFTQWDPDEIVFFTRTNSANYDLYSPGTYTSTAVFYHVAITYKSVADGSSEMRLYADGTEVASYLNANEPLDNPTLDMYVGCRESDYTSLAFDGVLDEARIWNSVRTADEIKMEWATVDKYSELITFNAEEASEGQNATDVNLWLDSAQNNLTVTYGASINASANINTTGLWVAVLHNSSLIANGTITAQDSTVWGVGGHNFTAYFSGNDDYYGDSQTFYATVNKAQSGCTLSLNPASPVTYGTQLTAVCSCNTTAGNVKIYRNSTDVTSENNTAVTLGAGGYGYVCNITSTENYTSASDSESYVVSQAPSYMNMWFNAYQNQNVTLSLDTVVLTNISSTCGNVGIWRLNNTEDTSLFTWVVDQESVNNTYRWTNSSGYSKEALNYYIMKGNASSNDNCTANDTGLIFKYQYSSALAVYDYNEQTSEVMTFNITLSNTTFSFTDYNKNPFVANATNMPYGDVSFVYWTEDHAQRKRYIIISAEDTATHSVYSLATSEGHSVSFLLMDSSENPINNVLLTAKSLVGSSWVVVDQEKTDSSGIAQLFLKSTSSYNIKFNKTGYTDVNTTIIPSESTYKVYLSSTATQPTGYDETMWDNITLKVSPIGHIVMNETTTFNYTIVSLDSSLEWWGFNLTHGNGTVLYSNNTTGIDGGSMTYTIDLSLEGGQNLTWKMFFKKAGFTAWIDPMGFTIANYTGQGLRSIFGYMGNYLDTFTIGIIAIFIAIALGGMLSSTIPYASKLGGGIVMLAILAIFIYYFNTTLWGWGIWSIAAVVVSFMLYKENG